MAAIGTVTNNRLEEVKHQLTNGLRSNLQGQEGQGQNLVIVDRWINEPSVAPRGVAEQSVNQQPNTQMNQAPT